MKKFLVSILAMLSVALGFVSCSNSDDNDITASVVAGTYGGKAKMVVETGEGEQNVGEYNTTATITSVSEKSLKIQIEGFGSGHFTMPSFEIANCSINSVNDKIALITTPDFEFVHNNVEYSCKMTGTYNIRGEVELSLMITPGAMPFSINVMISLEKK